MTSDPGNLGTFHDAGAAREPLIDINMDLGSPDAPAPPVAGRRRRLSDVHNRPDDLQPEPQSHRPCLSQTAVIDRESPICEPDVTTSDPKSIDIQLPGASTKPRRTVCKMHQDDGAIESAVPVPIQREPLELRSRPCFQIAAAGGLLAAGAGALAWAAIASAANAPVPWMALGIGVLVGGAVRILGRGSDRSFGCLGVGLSLFSCLLGTCLGNCAIVARDVELSLTSLLTQISPGTLPRLIVATFHPLDILLCGLALYLAYRLSFKRITRS